MNDLIPYIAAGVIFYALYKDRVISNEEAIFFANMDIHKSSAESLKFTPYIDKIISIMKDPSFKGNLSQFKGLFVTVKNFSSNLLLLANNLRQVTASGSISSILNIYISSATAIISATANQENGGVWSVLEYKNGISNMLKSVREIANVWEQNKNAFTITNDINKKFITAGILLQTTVLNAMTIF